MATSSKALILKVTTTDGSETTHNYPLSTNKEESRQVVDDVFKRLRVAIDHEALTLVLKMPVAIYNWSNVTSVRIEGPETIEEEINNRALGFKLADDAEAKPPV